MLFYVAVGGVERDGADEHGAVGAVVGEGLAAPPAGDEAASGVAEVGAAIGLGAAGAGSHPGSDDEGLDAVAEPVGARR